MLARQTPPQWLLSGLLRQRQAAVILGPSRCLKTSLAVDLCAALASGGQFLGQFSAERAFQVGFVGGEETQDVVANSARRSSAAADVDPPSLDRIVWAFNLISPGEPVNLRRLSDWIERHQLEVVLIDAADLTSASTPKAETAQLRSLVRCCLAAGATPIVCARTRKELRPRTMDTSDLASAPCGAVARQWLLVNRREAFTPGTDRQRLWLTHGNDAGQSGLWGVDIEEGADQVTLRDRASVEQESAELAAASLEEHLKRKVRAVLKRIKPADATKLRIREWSGMSGAKFRIAWDGLIDGGEITFITPADPNRQSSESRYRLIDPSEPKNFGRVHNSPIDQYFQTMTTAELLAANEKKSPPSPVDPPATKAVSGNRVEPSPSDDEKTSPQSPLDDSPRRRAAILAQLEKISLESSPLESPPAVEKKKAAGESSPLHAERAQTSAEAAEKALVRKRGKKLTAEVR
ncbi:AAA family ATPase [Blastopirellula sp. JC732]|uniref:AAA family ATPase n=1 Tax=Blastopirellula sediminis TaxID=2894196 RepID=A0A9X1MSR0_9BACT|nr:AAA family ATPase [Blastopirellula sediminis]MCC9604900.1 AAA family ATPase [Blastopirellula sediminis]MCC9631800.1 AAA family ATPase [Blastopirellula sediminis]